MGNKTKTLTVRVIYNYDFKEPLTVNIWKVFNETVFYYFTHREDGPAIEYSNGTKQWWKNGLLTKSEP